MNNIQAVVTCLNQNTGNMCPAGFQNSLTAVIPVGLLFTSLSKWNTEDSYPSSVPPMYIGYIKGR